MKFKRSNIISFSATGTTKKIVRKISEKLNFPETVYFDILKERNISLSLHENEIAIFGIPVYSGRVPEIVAETLKDIKGNKTLAI